MGVPSAGQRNANSETENTPLLSSSSSRTENGGDREVFEGGADGSGSRKGDGDSNQSVTGLRACSIIASLGVLIFLQGMLISFFLVLLWGSVGWGWMKWGMGGFDIWVLLLGVGD